MAIDTTTERLVTVRELAEILGMHEVSIRRLTGRGEIPSLKIGRRAVRYDLAAVLAHVRRPDGATRET